MSFQRWLDRGWEDQGWEPPPTGCQVLKALAVVAAMVLIIVAITLAI